MNIFFLLQKGEAASTHIRMITHYSLSRGIAVTIGVIRFSQAWSRNMSIYTLIFPRRASSTILHQYHDENESYDHAPHLHTLTFAIIVGIEFSLLRKVKNMGMYRISV